MSQCQSLSPRFSGPLAISLLPLLVCTALASDNLPDPIRDGVKRLTVQDLKRHCETLASDAFEGREAGTSGGHAASAYLQMELRKIRGVAPAVAGGWIQEFGSSYRNVIGQLPGSDPKLRHEVIVIGAHYDHVGRGNKATSLGGIGYIHNGADDNASGAAALLELADAFASLRVAPRRTILFAFWDAEEIGLLGSRHWIANPTHPLQDARLGLNVDMIGRLRDGKVAVIGWRSAPGLRTRLAAHNSTGDLAFQFEPSVSGDSDHHSFYSARIPCLHLDTGKHDDYHKPSDDADKLNYEGMRRLTELVFLTARHAADDPDFPAFRSEALTELPPAWLSGRSTAQDPPRLGVSFEPKEFKQKRAVILQVTPGSAAARAGIRPGDRLMKVARWNEGSAADLKTMITIARNPVDIRLERPGIATPVDLQLELSGDAVRVGIGWESDTSIPGSMVLSKVVPDSPADRAGLKVGDVVERLSGQPIGSDKDIRRCLLNDAGPIRMRVERGGRISDIEVDLFSALQN